MGNSKSTQSRTKQSSARSSTYLSLTQNNESGNTFLKSKKKHYSIVTSSASGFCIDKEMSIKSIVIECPVCKSVNPDNGLEHPVKCLKCSKIFLLSNGVRR